MKTKKILCTLMAGTMLATAFAGCGNEGSSSENNENSAITGQIYPITREAGSGTRSAFSELFEIVDADGNDAITETAESTSSTSVMMTTVAGNNYSIGYVSLGSLSGEVKAVKIDGAECTVNNVKNGAYKISRPFNICYKEENLSDVANDFKAYVLSTEGQQIVESEGYIPIDNTAPYKAKKLSGKVTMFWSSKIVTEMSEIK